MRTYVRTNQDESSGEVVYNYVKSLAKSGEDGMYGYVWELFTRREIRLPTNPSPNELYDFVRTLNVFLNAKTVEKFLADFKESHIDSDFTGLRLRNLQQKAKQFADAGLAVINYLSSKGWAVQDDKVKNILAKMAACNPDKLELYLKLLGTCFQDKRSF